MVFGHKGHNGTLFRIMNPARRHVRRFTPNKSIMWILKIFTAKGQ